MPSDFYKGKKIFLTGHTGFKGAWLHRWLIYYGADVLGYSLAPETKLSLHTIIDNPKDIYADILDHKTLEKTVFDFQPDIVFHLAAQSLVRTSYSKPQLTYQTNVIGTLNVLEAAHQCKSVKAFVNVTTDKCYENKEKIYVYKEDDVLGGYDMYSSSKACSELLSASYRQSFLQNGGYALACARAGNVIGGGDWAVDRLVPDCIQCIEANDPIEIRNPTAIRPWQHVLEPLSGYLLLAKKLFIEGHKYAEAYNFGPEDESILEVANIAQKIIDLYGKGELLLRKHDDLHEAEILMLNIDKAKSRLNWKPKYKIDESIKKTVLWYKNFYKNKNMQGFTLQQIEDYCAI